MSTSALAPTAPTTLVILLGASAWPNSPGFQASKAFVHASQGFKDYLLDPHGFDLPMSNLLDLFDAQTSTSDQLETLGSFLKERTQTQKAAHQAVRDVLVYFVGHGGFAGPSADFYLLPRRANASSLKASGMAIDALAEVLREKARQTRRYLFLDCCFAAAAFHSFQGGPDQTAIAKTLDAFHVQHQSSGFPGKGTVLLCSSDQKSPSLLLPDESCTMFSHALLDVLKNGDPHRPLQLSLRDLKELAEDRLAALPEDNAPRPGLYSPEQSEGDVADVPFFLNPRAVVEQARQVEQERLRVEEERARQAEEEKRQQAEEEEQASQVKQLEPEPELAPVVPVSETTDTNQSQQPGEMASLVPVINLSTLRLQPRYLNPGPSRKQTLGIITAVLLVIVVCGVIIFEVIHASNQASIAAARATSTAIAQVSATNIAQIDPKVARSNPDPYPPTTGRLTLYDPMSDHSNQRFGWSERTGSDGGSKCQFTNDGYAVSLPASPSGSGTGPGGCVAENTDLSNFAFEVQMTINVGDCGGIFFRVSGEQLADFYEAIFCRNGYYGVGVSNSQAAFVSGSTSLLKAGLGQSKIIAVVANGDTFNFYVNQQKIASVKDDTFSHGAIGVLASNYGSNNHPCDVVYHNAKVWTF
jgi:uncharacterized caspase-like protein